MSESTTLNEHPVMSWDKNQPKDYYLHAYLGPISMDSLWFAIPQQLLHSAVTQGSHS